MLIFNSLFVAPFGLVLGVANDVELHYVELAREMKVNSESKGVFEIARIYLQPR